MSSLVSCHVAPFANTAHWVRSVDSRILRETRDLKPRQRFLNETLRSTWLCAQIDAAGPLWAGAGDNQPTDSPELAGAEVFLRDEHVYVLESGRLHRAVLMQVCRMCAELVPSSPGKKKVRACWVQGVTPPNPQVTLTSTPPPQESRSLPATSSQSQHSWR